MFLRIYIILIMATLAIPPNTTAKINVVASTNDLAYFAHEIGGDFVEVSSIASPTADVHFVEVRPSYMMKVKKADLALKVGMELDLWMDQIIDGSRNNHLRIVDCSQYIERLEVPTFHADARYGDLHRFGNPHYWLGPQNVAPITQAIVEGLSEADPEHATQFADNRQTYLAELEKELPALRERASQLAGKEVIFYHNSWPYFCKFTGMVAAGYIEPYPGVAPSPSHVAEVMDLVKLRKIKVIAVEPYFDRRVPDKIGSDTGARVITLYPSIGGRNKDETYLEWLKGNMSALEDALR
jgi:zinc/manganese transport system substrate-binding protein